MVRLWDPFRTWETFELDMDRLSSRTPTAGYPPINVYTDADDVLVTTEIPGIEPAEIDLSVAGDTLTSRANERP
jgi:HSP20 family protein